MTEPPKIELRNEDVTHLFRETSPDLSTVTLDLADAKFTNHPFRGGLCLAHGWWLNERYCPTCESPDS